MAIGGSKDFGFYQPGPELRPEKVVTVTLGHPVLAGLTLKVARQLCWRLAQYFIRGSCIFTVLAQFAHFSKLRKKCKHCANAISLQKNMPKAKPQLLTDLLDELCQFSDIFQFFVIFQSV